MTTDVNNPCLDFEQQGHLAFYQALLADYKLAWECLYIRAAHSFVPYARQRSAVSTDDALDILQDGMAEFALNLKTGKFVFQGKPVAAYVFTICRNQWVSFLRKNNIRKVDVFQETDDDGTYTGRETVSTSELTDGQTGTLAHEEPNRPDVSADSIWESSEVDWKAVGRAFAEVGADCQAMLHCFYVEEKTLGECGSRIGLQENSAKVKRFRCAQRLKALYSQYKTA
ncbi:RNA polymerase sigma factor [Spirosoma luteum]|uniref:RNA polymerase sigma factor n=1 Tax=Spirosoma luteum TaxID=431553 RepID=UPI00036FC744|nr:sigma-70 family RNA polymerase sigma factor [Spirosoma luteum]